MEKQLPSVSTAVLLLDSRGKQSASQPVSLPANQPGVPVSAGLSQVWFSPVFTLPSFEYESERRWKGVGGGCEAH